MSTAKSKKVLVLTLGNGINILINFLTLPYLVRSLSYTDYGSYGQVFIVINFLQGIFTYNFHQIANIYLAKKEVDPKLVFSSLMRTSLIASLVSMIVMAVFTIPIAASFNNPALKSLLLFSLINLAGQVPIPILFSVLIFYGRVKASSAILIITNILKVIMMFITIHYFHSITYLMAGLSIISVVQLIMLYCYIPVEIRSISHADKKLVKGFVTMATPLTISGIVERSVIYIDGIMISSLLMTSQYALYRAGAIEVPFISTLYSSVAVIVMPEVARLFADGNLSEILRMKRRVIGATAFFVYPILIYLLLFSREIVTFYLSSKYSESAIVFAIFNLALFVRINDYQDVIIVSGKSRFIFQSAIIILLLNFIMNYTLIRTLGIEGGAIAFISVLFIFAGMLTWKTCKILKCDVSQLFNFPLIVKTILLSAAIGLPFLIMHKEMFSNIWFVIVSAPVYLIFVYLLGLRIGLIEQELLLQMSAKIPLLPSLLKWIHGTRDTK